MPFIVKLTKNNMLLALFFILQVFAIGNTLILGAGPVGLWTAFKILQSNPNVQVVIAEKREKFLTRDHIIVVDQFLVSELCDGFLNCPQAKTSIGTFNFEEAESSSVLTKNLQTAILERLDQYSSRFQIVKLNSLLGSASKVEISLDKIPFTKEFIPQTIIDATGSKSHLMNGILKVPYDSNHHYTHGSALHFAWPTKLSHPDSNGGRRAGPDSAHAIYADPFEGSTKFFTKWGFKVDKRAKPYPGANYRGNVLNAVFKLLSDPRVDQGIKSRIENIFVEIQRSGKNGMGSSELVGRLDAIYKDLDPSHPAFLPTRKLANAVLRIGRIGTDWNTLKQVRVTFIPERVEKHLTKIKVDNVPVKLDIAGSVRNIQIETIALGDSLGTSDFSWSHSTNRGFSMVNRIFRNGENPNTAFNEMVERTFLTANTADMSTRRKAAFAWIKRSVRGI